MLLAVFSQSQIIALGLLILCTGLMLRRSARRTRRVRSSDALSDAQRGMHQAEQSVVSAIRRMEVGLHDCSRDIEGRVQTRIALLEELIHDAQEETDRLQAALAEVQTIMKSTAERPPNDSVRSSTLHHEPAIGSATSSSLDPRQTQAVIDLSGVGFTAEEIANHLGCESTDVEATLNRYGRADAA